MMTDASSPPRAKKSLGQNFLQDRNIAERIVNQLDIGPEDHVLEIGPGPGALTRYIHAKGPRAFFVLEKDDHWAAEHATNPPAGDPVLTVVQGDALSYPWCTLTPGISWKVIGNLPYNVASPLMWDILSQASGLVRAVFMIQKEVGDRIVAVPGNKQYGALSVWLQSFCVPRRAFIVPPTVFKPRPKVDSAVLRFDPLPRTSMDFDSAALSWFLKVCFQQRRKQMQTILKGYFGSALAEGLASAGVEPTARPETLSPRQFQILATTMKNRIPA